MSSTPLRKTSQTEELLPWFVNHMRSFEEGAAVVNDMNPNANHPMEQPVLAEDESTDPEDPTSSLHEGRM